MGFLRIVARFYCLFVFDNATEIAKALTLTFIVFPEQQQENRNELKAIRQIYKRQIGKATEIEMEVEVEMEMETTKCVKPRTDIF